MLNDIFNVPLSIKVFLKNTLIDFCSSFNLLKYLRKQQLYKAYVSTFETVKNLLSRCVRAFLLNSLIHILKKLGGNFSSRKIDLSSN